MKRATRCLLFVILAAIPLCPATDNPCTIQVLVGEHKSVTVTIPCIARPDLINIVSDFWSKGDDRAKKRFEDVLGDSGEITFTLTTRRP